MHHHRQLLIIDDHNNKDIKLLISHSYKHHIEVQNLEASAHSHTRASNIRTQKIVTNIIIKWREFSERAWLREKGDLAKLKLPARQKSLEIAVTFWYADRLILSSLILPQWNSNSRATVIEQYNKQSIGNFVHSRPFWCSYHPSSIAKISHVQTIKINY